MKLQSKIAILNPGADPGKRGAKSIECEARVVNSVQTAKKKRGYAHFRSKTRENPIVSQEKSHASLKNCYEQPTS